MVCASEPPRPQKTGVSGGHTADSLRGGGGGIRNRKAGTKKPSQDAALPSNPAKSLSSVSWARSAVYLLVPRSGADAAHSRGRRAPSGRMRCPHPPVQSQNLSKIRGDVTGPPPALRPRSQGWRWWDPAPEPAGKPICPRRRWARLRSPWTGRRTASWLRQKKERSRAKPSGHRSPTSSIIGL